LNGAPRRVGTRKLTVGSTPAPIHSRTVQVEIDRYTAAWGTSNRRRGALPSGHGAGTTGAGVGVNTGAAGRALGGEASGASAGAAGAGALELPRGLRPGRRRKRFDAAARGSEVGVKR